MDGKETYDQAITDLELIAERYEARADGCGETRDGRRERARYLAQAEALRAAAEELREGGEDGQVDDIDDVTSAVLDLAEYLRSQFEPLPTPTHPLAGADRGAGRAGHCSICAVVGHEVAHPDRSCAAVGCDGRHGPAETADEVRIVHTYGGLGPEQLGYDPATTLLDLPRF